MSSESTVKALQEIVGDDHAEPAPAAVLADATEWRAIRGQADALVHPGSADEVAAVLAWCYEHDLPLTTRGGGSGLSGGAVPLYGGVVLELSRMTAVRSFEPEQWRIHVDAGISTAEIRRRTLESGLWFPPDPGAWEQSTIGGNIATNAGGPHTYRYGVTGTWVMGLEVVVPPGEVITVGGPVRKDVAGLDLKRLLIGSEGILGVITGAWLRLMPAPEAAFPVVAAFATIEAGQRALDAVLASGIEASVLEFLDGAALAAAASTFPGPLPRDPALMLIAEADGTPPAAAAARDALVEVLGAEGQIVHQPDDLAGIRALWLWRDGVSLAAVAQRGGKVSEDIVVPPDRLGEAIAATLEIGARHGLHPCSWGHAGDGNLHATFMVDRTDADELARAHAAGEELFDLAIRLGGTISGEHGIGSLKLEALERLTAPAVTRLTEAVKDVFDPKGLLNPGTVLADRRSVPAARP